ncbi:MAG: hypothetical protein A2Y17_04920 [Clostridiales bacterium GWF2_38_85]|nr:MAG: hypothetical protein A2Y17_04920 [Clostridiales bacterium GWF2_38_85]HBL84370.1 hypothetical protein [Clostridiales bacterium]
MSKPNKNRTTTPESYHPKTPEIVNMMKKASEIKIKSIEDMRANVNEVEILKMPQMKLIGRETRLGGRGGFLKGKDKEIWETILEDGSFDTIQKLPYIIPKSFMAWTGNYTNEDGTFAYIIGKFVPMDTPVPRGFTARLLPETLVAKGIYGQGYSMIDIYKNWGYTQNYDLFGWNAELIFDDDPDEHDWLNFCEQKLWTNLSPVKKVDIENKGKGTTNE